MFQRHVGVPLRSWTAAWVCTPLGRAVAPLRGIAARLLGRCCGVTAASTVHTPQHHSLQEDTLGLPPVLSLHDNRGMCCSDHGRHGSSSGAATTDTAQDADAVLLQLPAVSMTHGVKLK
jgi:hypothetical protein